MEITMLISNIIRAFPAPTTPLTPEEIVSDKLLRELGEHSPCREVGELSAVDHAVLATSLPEITAELLAFRAAARRGAFS
jgi:hypothetical protein